MALFTKKIIGYSFSKTMDTKITIEALNKAYKKQKPDNDLIIHSDREIKSESNNSSNSNNPKGRPIPGYSLIESGGKIFDEQFKE